MRNIHPKFSSEIFLSTSENAMELWTSDSSNTYPLLLTEDRGGTGGAESEPLFNELQLLLRFKRLTLPEMREQDGNNITVALLKCSPDECCQFSRHFWIRPTFSSYLLHIFTIVKLSPKNDALNSMMYNFLIIIYNTLSKNLF